MAKDGEYHAIRGVRGTDVHDSDHKRVGWADNEGNVHEAGDTGGWTGNPKNIGTVDDRGNVTMGDKK